jgi:hypothetical protein
MATAPFGPSDRASIVSPLAKDCHSSWARFFLTKVNSDQILFNPRPTHATSAPPKAKPEERDKQYIWPSGIQKGRERYEKGPLVV